ncbi:P27 family phage terminase small subunit [Sporosarcina jiandibaonis]|uniref:P27 family phage terminase small subunit n=1 Tax=Sporosarcina jiandibaonis TaxID=2715535 RepID=UPI00155814C7|nr:P27 family phage terminase small subunit [Sporosarcina jiandibaonis]
MDSKRGIELKVRREMESIGVYRKEFDMIINIYAGMLHQYLWFEKEFHESEYQITEPYTNKAGATNERKVPLLTAMESLRKDIASYSDRLCLSPKSLEKVVIDSDSKSVLTSILKELD